MSKFGDKYASLLDVQGLQDERGVDIQQVGVKEVDIPLQLVQKDGKLQAVSALATLSVGLPKEHKGTHMSRFIIQLSEWSRDKALTMDLKEFLEETKTRLSSTAAHIDLKFKYFMEKMAPVSQMSAPMAYECSISGKLIQDQYQIVLGVIVPIATLCPCSKAISDYGAHNQRAEIRAQVIVDTQTEHSIVWFEDLITSLEKCSSCEVFPLVKREDEKFMTEWAYDHPKFVEDVIREAILTLRDYPNVSGFSLEVEALESIHGHNAWATHQENF